MKSLRFLVVSVLSFLGTFSVAAPPPKILIVMSGATEVNLTEGKTLKTGYFLRELSDPLEEIEKAGFEVVFASPEGKVPEVDEFSTHVIWYRFPNPLKGTETRDHALEVIRKHGSKLGDLKNPIKLGSLTEADLEQYQGVFVPGGHSPIKDLINNPEMAKVLTYFHKAKKPTALICHAPIALLSTFKPNGDWIYRGYQVAVATTKEEQIMEVIGPMAPHQLSFDVHGVEEHYVDTPLAKAGAILHRNIIPSMPWVSQDRELITGQNPASAKLLGYLFVNSVRAQQSPGLIDLRSKSTEELAKLFIDAGKDTYALPEGDAIGTPLLIPDQDAPNDFFKKLFPDQAFTLNSFASLFWGGKIFSLDEDKQKGTLLNKIFGMNSGRSWHAIRAVYSVGNLSEQMKLAKGTTLPGIIPGQDIEVDGKNSILLDYRASATVLTQFILDEIRPVLSDKYPGLYLGRATSRDKKFWCYFALQFPTKADPRE